MHRKTYVIFKKLVISLIKMFSNLRRPNANQQSQIRDDGFLCMMSGTRGGSMKRRRNHEV